MKYAIEYEEFTGSGNEVTRREVFDDAASAKRRAARLSKKLSDLIYALKLDGDGQPVGQVVYWNGFVDSRDGEPVR